MNLGNVAKIDALMGTARDFPLREAGADYRYCLCSTARCGSNLVSDMLHQTGLAGDPMEYLNPRYINGYLRTKQRPAESLIDLSAYMTEMERRRSSSNGHFGIKVHFEHLQAHFRHGLEQALPFMRRFDRIVLLRRRDKIAQAVSLHKARVTQIWSSLDYEYLEKDDPRLKRKAQYDPIAIGRALSDILQQDYGWESLLQRAGIAFEELWYEDFVQDPAAGSERLLGQLGLRQAAAAVKGPSLSKQGADNDPMVAAFRQAIGA